MSASNLPVEVLEQRAGEQRRKLHNSVSELKSSVRDTVRERLEVKRYVREYFWPATAAVSLVALLVGYRIASVFARRRSKVRRGAVGQACVSRPVNDSG